MAILTFATGLPGGTVTWWQGEAAPAADPGEVVIAYQPQDGEPLPAMKIGGDGATLLPKTDLDQALSSRKAEATAYRDQRQGGGCMTPLGRVDTDADRSIPLITGAGASALAALTLGLPFPPKKWTMADNSEVAHTAQQIIAMGMAVTAFVDACQQACVAVKKRMDAATTLAQLAAIDVTSGYPAA